MKLVVTGASGLVGSTLCRVAASQHQVRGTYRSEPTPVAGIQQVAALLDDRDSLREAFAGADAVIHCAAVYAYGTARHDELEATNTTGTTAVIEMAAAAGVPRVVVTSSSVTCGSSADGAVLDERAALGDEYAPPYFESKLHQEAAARAAAAVTGVEVVIGCPTVVLGGPTTRLVPSNAILLRYLLDPTRSTYPGGCNLVGADDVARGLVLLAEHGRPGERYLIGGENLSWHSIHALTADLAGVGTPRLEVPTTVTFAASAAAELWSRLIGTEPLSTREEALTVGRYYWYSSDKLAEFGYTPGSARQAIATALAWLLAGPDLSRWVKEGLRPAPEVRTARRLVPRVL